MKRLKFNFVILSTTICLGGYLVLCGCGNSTSKPKNPIKLLKSGSHQKQLEGMTIITSKKTASICNKAEATRLLIPLLKSPNLKVRVNTASTLKHIGINAKEAVDRKSTRLNSSHIPLSRMPSSA